MKKVLFVAVAVAGVFSGGGFAAGKMLVEPSIAAAAAAAADGVSDEANGHGDTQAEIAQDGGHGEEAPKVELVELGRIMVPIYQPRKITYIIGDISVAATEKETVDYLKSEGGTVKMRNDIISSILELSEIHPLTGAEPLDSEFLSSKIRSVLAEDYKGLDDIMFLNLMKSDMSTT